MHAVLGAHARLLWVWRILLTLAALPLAFLTSFFLTPLSTLWWVLTGALAAVYLFFFLIYLPIRRRAIFLLLNDQNLVLSEGVFNVVERSLPIAGIQYIRVRATPIHRRLGLSTFVVVCAGGKLEMPGLGHKEVDKLIKAIFGQMRKDRGVTGHEA
ncbi:MAG: PH domain-containing protein [Oscillospiraceae bacterium]|nr:PH domain-containing protein [Oscillospiraceae bacterium]